LRQPDVRHAGNAIDPRRPFDGSQMHFLIFCSAWHRCASAFKTLPA
jgi:hypothetical protein